MLHILETFKLFDTERFLLIFVNIRKLSGMLEKDLSHIWIVENTECSSGQAPVYL